jgi:UPF0755 protein
VGAFLIIGAIALMIAVNGPGPAARDGNSTTVVLRSGAGLSEISATLERSGVTRSAALFSAMAQLTGSGRSLRAGEYSFPTRASMSAVLRQIKSGRVVRHFVTVPEGYTSEMVVDVLMREPNLTGAVPAPPEGTVLPETYEFHRGEDRAAVLQRMMDARDRLLATLWEHRKAGLPFATPDEAVILASIVEKETGMADERPRVAAVFVNRLRSGMRLESDPTIIYGLTRGRPLGHGLRQSELAQPNPYNTYQIDGLPPTPIANPGRAALAAVLDPPDTTELYFVASGSGGRSLFASDLPTHSRNVARLREIERQRAEAAARAAAAAGTTPPPPPPPPTGTDVHAAPKAGAPAR